MYLYIFTFIFENRERILDKVKKEAGKATYIIRNFLSEDKRIIIKFTNLDGKEKEIKLFNQEERVQGTINLAFMGSMGKIKVSTPLVSFGEEFVKADIENADSLTIEIPGTSTVIRIPNLETFRGGTLSVSERALISGEEGLALPEVGGVTPIIRDVNYQQN